jgi:hypothetical protein
MGHVLRLTFRNNWSRMETLTAERRAGPVEGYDIDAILYLGVDPEKVKHSRRTHAGTKLRRAAK